MPFPASLTLYPNNDQYIELDGLALGLDGTVQNAATVSVTIFDSTNTAVPNASTISMAYVAASVGVYRGLIPNSFAPITGTSYYAVVTATSGTLKATWQVKVTVATRIS